MLFRIEHHIEMGGGRVLTGKSPNSTQDCMGLSVATFDHRRVDNSVGIGQVTSENVHKILGINILPAQLVEQQGIRVNRVN